MSQKGIPLKETIGSTVGLQGSFHFSFPASLAPASSCSRSRSSKYVSDAQWPWEKKGTLFLSPVFCCWLSLRGNAYPRKGNFCWLSLKGNAYPRKGNFCWLSLKGNAYPRKGNFCWLSLKGNAYPRKEQKGAPMGNRDILFGGTRGWHLLDLVLHVLSQVVDVPGRSKNGRNFFYQRRKLIVTVMACSQSRSNTCPLN